MIRSSDDEWTDVEAYDLEFRSAGDEDAWFSVRGLLEGETFLIKFLGFLESSDLRFNAGDFQTLQAVDEFVRRFRPVSAQVQDSECSKIVQGLTVCSSYEFKCDDVRFYDAVVDAVHHEQHSFKKEEECMCTFVLCWKHGPNVGNLTFANIASICLIQSVEQLNSRVASFAKIAKEKIEIASLKSGAISESSLLHHGLQETEPSRQFGSAGRTTEGRVVIQMS
ncbi:uncharacterized protein LOC132309669 [Cornus florida]|uniref:uncharacterized protein LOC132309669 n=1 Tax=Cornus florida TaxID=4283 RepID=UPI002898ED6B|nr:uncharacterized protein LOC132309669 [Cornus florida]